MEQINTLLDWSRAQDKITSSRGAELLAKNGVALTSAEVILLDEGGPALRVQGVRAVRSRSGVNNANACWSPSTIGGGLS